MKSSILLIYTGGTIGMICDEVLGVLKPFEFDNLLQQIPQLQKIRANIDTLSVEKPKDSAEMHPEDWQNLGQLIFDNYEKYSGFVVLHGTDTMAYTTSALSFMFKNLSKPIIFTGSQLPIGDIRTDAIENVLTSIQIALLKKGGLPLVNEVCLYFGNQLFRGSGVTKISSQNFNAFASSNVPILATSNINLSINEAVLISNTRKKTYFSKRLDEAIFLYKIHPGINQKQFEQICESVFFKVLILETYGSGTIFVDDWMLEKLAQLIANGVHIINTSQCIFGNVKGIYGATQLLSGIGVINAKAMTTEAVVTKSMCLLTKKIRNDEFSSKFIENWVGELS